MNATIEKIVNLLFEDLVETEETIAIREEILQNCQDRYQDLREAGISEDDAIHAVIESLSGMEEMLSEYPRKADEPAAVPEASETVEAAESNEEQGDEGPRTWSHDPAQSPIREIRMEHMASADVYVKPSQDHLIHVECSNPDLTLMTGLENDVLTIALTEQKPEEVKDEIKFSLQDGFDLASLGKMFEKLARKFTSSMANAEVTLYIPADLSPSLNIHTASGNVEIEPMMLEQLQIGTASGDMTFGSVQVIGEARMTSASGDIAIAHVSALRLQMSSTSGDLEANNCTAQEDVRLNTTSGDITWSGSCRSMEASAISGDMELEGMAETVSFKTVSGDVTVTLHGEHLCSVNGKSVSGDVEVYLPDGMHADVRCSTVAGDIHNHAGSVPDAAVTVTLATTAGDIEVN